MNLELVISMGAAAIALYAVLIQRKELAAQRDQLSRSAEANETSAIELNVQNQLQTLSALLDAEIHLHKHNDKGGISEKQPKWASDNLNEILRLKSEINKLLDGRV